MQDFFKFADNKNITEFKRYYEKNLFRKSDN